MPKQIRDLGDTESPTARRGRDRMGSAVTGGGAKDYKDSVATDTQHYTIAAFLGRRGEYLPISMPGAAMRLLLPLQLPDNDFRRVSPLPPATEKERAARQAQMRRRNRPEAPQMEAEQRKKQRRKRWTAEKKKSLPRKAGQCLWLTLSLKYF